MAHGVASRTGRCQSCAKMPRRSLTTKQLPTHYASDSKRSQDSGTCRNQCPCGTGEARLFTTCSSPHRNRSQSISSETSSRSTEIEGCPVTRNAGIHSCGDAAHSAMDGDRHERELKDRVDRRDLEPCERLYENPS